MIVLISKERSVMNDDIFKCAHVLMTSSYESGKERETDVISDSFKNPNHCFAFIQLIEIYKTIIHKRGLTVTFIHI